MSAVLHQPGPQPAAARVSDRVFDSFVDHEEALTGWTQLYRQITPGSFRGRVTSLRLGPVTVSREETSQGLENQYRLPDGHALVGLTLPQGLAMHARAGALPQSAGVLSQPGVDHLVYLHPGSAFIMLTLPAAQIGTAGPPVARLDFPDLAQMTLWLASILETARTGQAREALLRLAPDLILDRLSMWFGDWQPAPAPSPRRGLMADIAIACDRLEPEDLSVTGLARCLDRDRATLRRACEGTTGFTLDDYLAGRRLSEVHRRLRRASPGTTTVSQTAADHGFLHWGRFSAAYRRMFGEAPSETLRRPG